MDEFNTIVLERINHELIKQNIKQKPFLELCAKAGMPISQPNLSKIRSGRKTPNLYEAAAIAKALDISLDSLVYGEDGMREDFCDVHDSSVLFMNGAEANYYEGRFQMYFRSTVPHESKILHGILDVGKKADFYALELKLYTGEVNANGSPIVKLYKGRILVSAALGAAYFILKNESIGEVCMICIRHRSYSIKKAECRVGLVLTVSAGDIKEPTVHRCVLVREEVKPEVLEGLRPWMRLVGNNIHIELSRMQKIFKEFAEQNSESAEELEGFLQNAPQKAFVDFNIDTLRRQLTVDREQFSGLLSRLYAEEDGIDDYRLSVNSDAHFYNRYETVKERGRS